MMMLSLICEVQPGSSTQLADQTPLRIFMRRHFIYVINIQSPLTLSKDVYPWNKLCIQVSHGPQNKTKPS